jgi:hypothetical protein
VNDRDSAVECIDENRILRRICPGTFEENDGLFVGISEEDRNISSPSSKAAPTVGSPRSS